MDIMVERCAGLDVGKEEVVACVRRPGRGGPAPSGGPDLHDVHGPVWRRWPTGWRPRG